MENSEQLDEKDRMRLVKILQEVKNLEKIKGRNATVSILRKNVGIKTAKFWRLLRYAKKEKLIAVGKKTWMGKGLRPGIKYILTEKGREFLEKYALQDPTASELTLERYGGARRIKIKFAGDVELRHVVWPFGISGRWPFQLILDDSKEIEIEPRGKLETPIESFGDMMWSFMVHSSSPDHGWSAYPGVGEEMHFKLLDGLHLSGPMAKLKRDYNDFWKSPSISGESKIEEKWIPHFLRDLAPSTIEPLKKTLEEWKGLDRESLKFLDPSGNLRECERIRQSRIKELEESIKRWQGAEKERQWISKMLEYGPNIFLPSPLWQKLGFLKEEDVVWPAEIQLPFNVNIVGWEELEISLEIFAQIDPLRDADLVMFTRPFDWGSKVKILGSPSEFIRVLEKHQATPAFYAVWRWRKNMPKELKERLEGLKERRQIYKRVHKELKWSEMKELEEECKLIRRKLRELKERDRATNILLPVDVAYRRFISERDYTNLAQAYIDVWKRCAGKKMTAKEITSVVKEAADAISEEKYNLTHHPKGGKGSP